MSFSTRNQEMDLVAESIFKQIVGGAATTLEMDYSNRAYLAFSGVLRKFPERTAGDILAIMEARLPPMAEREAIKGGAKKAFQDFQRWGCQIARYSDMTLLNKRYANSKEITLKEEIEFGEQSFKDAEKALLLCSDPLVKPKADGPLSFLDEKEAKPPYGLRIAFEYLIDRHYENAIRRGTQLEFAALMKKIRTGKSATPAKGYAWSLGLIHNMSQLAKTNTIRDLEPLSNYAAEIPEALRNCNGYALTYRGKLLSYVLEDPAEYHPWGKNPGPVWKHGQVAIKDFWPRLEEMHHEVMNFPLDKTNQKSLLGFYDKVVEMIWLLGNITPVSRGTGKLVEQWFTMAHLKHGLRTPVLKLDNPQIDVLDISLPLSLYKERFFEFFEFESLPRPVAEMSNSSKASLLIVQPTAREEKPVNTNQKFTRKDLYTIFDTYQTKSSLFHHGIVSKGYRSKTINAIYDLASNGEQSDEIKFEDVAQALTHSRHRSKLFRGETVPNKSDTDRVVVEIRDGILKRNKT